MSFQNLIIVTLKQSVYLLLCIIVPDVPQDLHCVSSSSPSELTVSWNPPSVLRGDKISYVIDVNALRHKSGTRDVIQLDITNRTTDMQSELIQNLGNILLVSKSE